MNTKSSLAFVVLCIGPIPVSTNSVDGDTTGKTCPGVVSLPWLNTFWTVGLRAESHGPSRTELSDSSCQLHYSFKTEGLAPPKLSGPQAFLSAWAETSVAGSSPPFQPGQMLPEAFPEAFQANVAFAFSLRPLEIEAETDCQWMLDGEAAS